MKEYPKVIYLVVESFVKSHETAHTLISLLDDIKVLRLPRQAKTRPARITFDGVGWSGLTADMIIGWNRAYPAINVQTELLKAAAWIVANPKNEKKNWERFLVNWFSRVQERGVKSFQSFKPEEKRERPLPPPISEVLKSKGML